MKYLLSISLLLVSCGNVLPVKPNEGNPVVKPTPAPKDGLNGKDGMSCSVRPVEGGATISCEDGSETFIPNGVSVQGDKGADAEPCVVSEGEATITFVCPTSTVTINKPQDGKDGEACADGIDGADGITPPYTLTTNTEVYYVGATSIPDVQFTCLADQRALRVRTGSSSIFEFTKHGSYTDPIYLTAGREYIIKPVDGIGGTFILNDWINNKKITKACSF
jgi:hypothetical protein